jgi:hypothetical protein
MRLLLQAHPPCVKAGHGCGRGRVLDCLNPYPWPAQSDQMDLQSIPLAAQGVSRESLAVAGCARRDHRETRK